MTERNLLRLARIGSLRKLAGERRLAEAQRLLDAALARSSAADRVLEQRIAQQTALRAQCYADPANPQAWIASAHGGRVASKAADNAAERQADVVQQDDRRAAAARTVLRDEAKSDQIGRRLQKLRVAAGMARDEALDEEFASLYGRKARA